MINAIYVGGSNMPVFEKEESYKAFLNRLGPFKNEFDENDGILTINFDEPKESKNYFAFIFGKQQKDLSDFIARYNQYITGIQ